MVRSEDSPWPRLSCWRSQQQVGLLFRGSKKLTQTGSETVAVQVPFPVQVALPPVRPRFRSYPFKWKC